MSRSTFRDEGPSAEPVRPVVPNHRLLRCIGKGSYGNIWIAIDAIDNWRAVKVVHRRETTGASHGYEREFNAVKKYEPVSRSHGSLVPIYTVGRDPNDRFFFYVMDLADDVRTNNPLEPVIGDAPEADAKIVAYEPRTLRSELRRRGRLPPAECVQQGIMLATALEQLHLRALIHRDIKPDNIIFVYGQPKLADIGLVADVDATYSLAGTMPYLSPEGTRKEPADIFALGKVLYEMVMGQDVGEFPAMPHNFAELPAEERSRINELSEVFCRACSPNVEERPSAQQLREELEMLKRNESVIDFNKLKEDERQRKLEDAERKRRNRIRLRFAAAVGLTIIVGALAFFLWTARKIATQRAMAIELREAQIARNGQRSEGWSSNNWARLRRVASSGSFQSEVKADAAIVLAGLDAHRIYSFDGKIGADAESGPAGRFLTTGDGVQPAAIIDHEGRRLESPVATYGKACWSRDGTPMIFTVESNSAVVLRDAESGATLWRSTLNTNLTRIRTLAVTPDGQRLAAGFSSKQNDRVLVWDYGRNEALGEIVAPASALAFTPDGSLMAVGGTDGTTQIYAIPEMKRVCTLGTPVRPNRIQCLAFSRDRVVRSSGILATNWLLAVGDHGTELVIWDIAAGLPRVFCRGSHWTLESVAFSPDGDLLASGGRNDPRIWDAHSGEMLLRMESAASSDITALAFSPDGNRLLIGSTRNSGLPKTGIWQLERDRGIRTLRGMTAVVRKIWFSPDNQHIAALSDQWVLAVWDVPTGRLIHQFEAPAGILADGAGGAFDLSGHQLGYASGTNACLFDLKSGRITAHWNLVRGFYDQLRFDREGRLLLIRTDYVRQPRPNREWRLYELKPGDKPKVLHAQSDPNWPAYNVALPSGADKFLVWSGGHRPGPRQVQVRDTATGKLLWEATTPLTNFHAGDHVDVSVDAYGKWFTYSPASNNPVSQISLNDYRETPTEKTPLEAVSPSGNEVVRSGWLIQQLRNKERDIPMASEWQPSNDTRAFSSNGRYLAWGSQKGLVFVADLPEIEQRIGALKK